MFNCRIRASQIAVLLSLLCVGCHHHSTPPDELVVGIAAEPPTLDPRFANDAYGMRISQLIFHGLVKVGPSFEPVPDAATSWTHIGKTYTFQIAPGLKFHNGRPVTVDDLKFSFDTFRSEKSPFASSFNNVGSFEARETNGHLEVTIQMKQDTPNFLINDLPSLKILPHAEIKDFPEKLIGTGSFRLVSKTDTDIELAAVPNHPILTPKIARVDFKLVHDDFTRFQKMQKGELDVVFNDLTAEKIPIFEKRKDEFSVYRFPSASTSYILINHNDPILKDKRLRKALSQSINRSEIITYKMEGLGRETAAIIPKEHPFFNTEIANPKFDLEAAKATVAALGLTGKHLIFKCSSSPSSMDTSKVLAYELSKSGLDIELESYEWGKYFSDVSKGNFQLAIMKWVGIFDPDIYRLAFHSSELPPLGRNRGRYINPELDRLLDQARAEFDPAVRRRLYLEVQRIVLEDYAILPLWSELQVTVMKKSVTGFEPSIHGDFDCLTKMTKAVQLDLHSRTSQTLSNN